MPTGSVGVMNRDSEHLAYLQLSDDTHVFLRESALDGVRLSWRREKKTSKPAFMGLE